jgi:hypothetical protein
MSQPPSYARPPSLEPATRQGQREIAAATLAAGMIAAARERITAEAAMAKMREVLEVLMQE